MICLNIKGITLISVKNRLSGEKGRNQLGGHHSNSSNHSSTHQSGISRDEKKLVFLLRLR